MVRLIHVQGGRAMNAVGRVLVVQSVVLVAGGLVLWWFAAPVRMDDVAGLGSISWALVLVPALTGAVLSGTCAGLSLRLGGRWVTGTLFVALGLPALYPPLFLVGRWPGSPGKGADLTDLVAAILGWLLYVVASTSIALTVGTRRHQLPRR